MKIRYAQWNELRYAWRASRLCILVLTTLSRGQPNEFSSRDDEKQAETRGKKREGAEREREGG